MKTVLERFVVSVDRKHCANSEIGLTGLPLHTSKRSVFFVTGARRTAVYPINETSAGYYTSDTNPALRRQDSSN